LHGNFNPDLRTSAKRSLSIDAKRYLELLYRLTTLQKKMKNKKKTSKTTAE